jgi:hypothetical protein
VVVEDITEVHLRSLIADGFAEQRTVEYKRELPGGNDDGKKEFLADVSSFANASGGDLLFGIEAEEGIPRAISPLSINPDSERLRWEETIRKGIQPRLPGVRVSTVPVDGGHVLLIRVPESFVGPHVVSFKNWSRFFSRTSAGKYQLDVDELRSVFLAGTTLADQIRNFRAERLSLIMVGDEPIPLIAGPKIVAHLIPYNAFSTRVAIQPNAGEGTGLFRPLFGEVGAQSRWNIDGFLTYDEDPSVNRVVAYSQVFRNGVFEGVDTENLKSAQSAEAEVPYIYALWFEKAINSGLANPLEVLRRAGVQPPIVVLVAILGAQNYRIRLPGVETMHRWRQLDRDVLLLPEVVVESFGYDSSHYLPKLFRPIVDAFYQAGGWHGSANYDGEGYWGISGT